jgi:hypothetical protein
VAEGIDDWGTAASHMFCLSLVRIYVKNMITGDGVVAIPAGGI